MPSGESHPPSAREDGPISRRDRLCLAAILLLALVLRSIALGWGLPPSTPRMAASEFRDSYAFDEDKILRSLSQTRPDRLDFDPELYYWGTLHLELVLLALEGSQMVGVFEQPWRDAFDKMIPGQFETTYRVGRAVSVLLDLFTVALVFLAGRRFFDRMVGLWAALFVAVSPGHVLQAHQIRVDVAATAFVLLTALSAFGAAGTRRRSGWILLGVAAGLAVAAKYSSVLMVAAMAAVALAFAGTTRRAVPWLCLGAAASFVLAQPFIVTDPVGVLRQVGSLISLSRQIPEPFVISKLSLVVSHLEYLARFSLGLPVALLAVWGVVLLVRKRVLAGWIVLAAIGAGILSFVPQNFPLLRYQLPLLPFFSLAAALALRRVKPPWRLTLGLLAVLPALGASLAQLHWMSSPHPANLALALAHKAIPPGCTVSRVMPELPPLDTEQYPLGPNPLLADLSEDPPAWVITSDLPLAQYPPHNQHVLENQYEKVAVFRSSRIFAWATLGEGRAPHDWKYTHPRLTVYRAKAIECGPSQ